MLRLYRILLFAMLAVAFGAIAGATAQTCAPVRPGLISSWKAEAVSGSKVSDLKGGNSEILRPGVTIESEQGVPRSDKIGEKELFHFDKAFHFNGKGGFIAFGDLDALKFGAKPFSLESWFYWDGGETNGEPNTIAGKWNVPVSDPGAGYYIRIVQKQQQHTLEFFVGEPVGNVGKSGIPRKSISTPNPIDPGVWHHTVATKDERGKMVLYLDGQRVSEGNIDASFNVDADTPFTIGAWNARYGPREFFSGFIYEVSVYDRALSNNEVKALFGAPKC